MPMATKQLVEEQWLRSVIIPDILKSGKLIADYVPATDSFKVHNIDIKFIGTDEAFMLTICYRAKIDFEYDGVNGSRTLVVKKTPEVPEEIFNSINFPALYRNEILGYNTILPDILKYSKVPLEVPTFYYGDLQNTSAVIVLEDFGNAGWQLCKQRFNLNLEHTLLAVKYLAQFHGICFALKQTERARFDSLIADLKEPRFSTPIVSLDWDVMSKTGLKRLIDVTQRYYPEIPSEYISKLKPLLENFFMYGKQRVQPVEPLATLCHGDYLRNNVAYKYEENTDNPIAIMMFDLQTMRYSSPMVDLCVFLSLSTFSAVRHNHFEVIFKAYCDVLATTYVDHAPNATLPDFLSHESLLKEYIRYLPYGINISSFFLMALVDPMEDTFEQQMNNARSEEEMAADFMRRGGKTVDLELAQQMKELYDLSIRYDVDMTEGIEL